MLSDKNLTYWERAALTKWGQYLTEIEIRALLKANELAVKPGTACEIGCDGGRWAKVLTDLNWEMICTDINEESLNRCKAKLPDALCILVDQNDTRIPCPPNSLNLLLCIEVAPVINSDWFIDEAFKALKNDGILIGVFWNFLSFRGMFGYIYSYLTKGYNYYKFSYPIWKKKVQKKGFVFLYEEGCCWFPFSRESNSPLIPFFTSFEKKMGLTKLIPISPWIVFIIQKK